MGVFQMADDSQEFLAYLTHLRAEHRELDKRLRRIEREWTDRPSKAVPQVILDLQTLRLDLAHHFEEEESGGCLDEAVSRQPSLGHEADRLQREHPELLKQLDRPIEMLKGRTQPDERANKAKEEFRHFAEALHAHEAAENRILEQSFGVDLE